MKFLYFLAAAPPDFQSDRRTTGLRQGSGEQKANKIQDIVSLLALTKLRSSYCQARTTLAYMTSSEAKLAVLETNISILAVIEVAAVATNKQRRRRVLQYSRSAIMQL